MTELLSILGKVETSFDVSSEARQIDVWFIPDHNLLRSERPNLGLIERMADNSCLFEVFRNPPTPVEVRTCLLKLYSLHGELLRQGRREKNPLKETDLPSLWILSPTGSETLLNGFGTRLNFQWGSGVNFLPDLQKTAIVVINQLPVTSDTLLLRVLGRGNIQKEAVEELIDLSDDNPFREGLLEILANWRVNVQLRDNLTRDDQEVLMNLSPAFEQIRQEWKEEARAEGRQAEKREIIEQILRNRFGSLNEELASTIELLLPLPTAELTHYS